ncbi:MAG: alanine--tRNA ligase [Candidatus Gastranaerophilales bacterium]|nr:alanine--tRNA ligase [Candidatus Gastranaerophilales bacterium]
MATPLTGNEIRRAFLDFFKEKHQSTEVKSSSLVPDNPTVLLTTAGMLQFLPYYLGLEKAPFDPARACSCQKCARAGGKDSDIENVGRTPRHHTFFEMLGNFSFGDYYKNEVIPWSWDFVTNYLKLDPERLWITIFETDDEAFDIWHNKVGIPADRIIRKGKKDNFWGPPGATGSCGPCSEIHYDLGEDLKCSDDCSIATCECDRWVEIWNLVFTELFQDEEGNQSPLDKKNVDTGMGLERITMVVQGKRSTFETDLLKPILDQVSQMTGVPYKQSEKTDISLRIITDHARCVSFMISDGVVPGNEGRSYVLRMIMRRALRHGKILGLELPFLNNLVDTIVDLYKEAYPELEKNRDKIKKTIKQEEERFNKTLDRGYKLINELIEKNENIDGESAFKLYDTFGFPLELTVEIAEEKGLKVDVEGFQKAMQEQKERAKAATQKISLTDDLVYVAIENEHGSTEFTGYDELQSEAKIIAKVDVDNNFVDVILDKTPFYGECGGQVGDTGFIENDSFKAEVLNTFRVNKLFVHRVQIINGELKTGETVSAKVDAQRRKNIAIHHTNAHLLQAALIKVLGEEVKQAGSYVDETKTRFDFSFSRAMTADEIQKVEKIMNNWISEGHSQHTDIMDIEEAKKTGAMALFGEKYDQKVRVVKVGNISSELCGGTHIKNTEDIRLTKIVSEGAVAAGTRRIEAICADSAFQFLNEKASEIDALAHKFKALPSEVNERVKKLVEENKLLQNELSKLKADMAKQKFQSFVSKAEDIKGGKLFISKLDGLDMQAVKTGVELLGSKLGNSIIVLVSVISSDQILIMVKVDDDFVKHGINAGKIVGEIAQATGGKGGGRPNFAQGAGKSTEGVDEILAKIKSDISNSL